MAAHLSFTLILASLAHRFGPRHVMGTPSRGVGIAAGLLVVAVLWRGLSWRSLSATPHGQRSETFLLLVLAALLAYCLLQRNQHHRHRLAAHDNKRIT